jgi:hypothetical protein
VPADHAVGGSTRRPICFVAVAAQRRIGRHERKWWSAALTPRIKRFIASVRVSRSTRRPQAIEYPFDLSKLLMSLSMSVVEVDSIAMGQKPNGSERSKYLPRAMMTCRSTTTWSRPMLCAIDAPRFEKGAPSGVIYQLSSVIL